MADDMVGVFERLSWALAARGLSPTAKLALILAADGADCECRYADLDALALQVNVSRQALDVALLELVQVGAVAVHRDEIELLVRGVGK